VTNLNAQKLEQIDQAIENYKALKLKVAITELDVTMTGAGGGQLGGGQRGTVTPPRQKRSRRKRMPMPDCLRYL
jgi:hypothetical protein